MLRRNPDRSCRDWTCFDPSGDRISCHAPADRRPAHLPRQDDDRCRPDQNDTKISHLRPAGGEIERHEGFRFENKGLAHQTGTVIGMIPQGGPGKGACLKKARPPVLARGRCTKRPTAIGRPRSKKGRSWREVHFKFEFPAQRGRFEKPTAIGLAWLALALGRRRKKGEKGRWNRLKRRPKIPKYLSTKLRAATTLATQLKELW